MSVIHEAIKKARAARQEKKKAPEAPPAGSAPSVVLRKDNAAPVWLLWVMLVLVLAEGALYLRERSQNLRSREKMRAAYLELNDARGEFLDKSASEKRVLSDLQEMESKYNAAVRSKAEVLKAKENVEFDNLAKQKKVNELTKANHELEMEKFRLETEVKTLKAELENAQAAATITPAPSN